VERTIDVVIPTYNRPSHAAQVAAQVAQQLCPGDALYVVWQGGARPNITETSAVHLVHSAPKGLPRARNAGVRAGSAAIILFLDDDVDVGSGLLEAHRSAYGNGGVSAVAGSIDDPLFTPKEPIIASFDTTTGRLVQNFIGHESGPTISLMGANMSFLRKTLESIGMFDQNFLHNALMEEVDAAFRVQKAGGSIWYCSTAQVKHLREASGGCREDGRATYLYHEFANIGYFAARHAPRRFWGSWFTYWKYRLEFESRKNVPWLRHDPWLAAAGALGACAGIIRYVMRGRKGMGEKELTRTDPRSPVKATFFQTKEAHENRLDRSL
jgi:GT2 family glycosyltransferase